MGVSPDRNPHIGLVGGDVQIKMVELKGKKLIQLFDTLADWEIILKDVEF